MKIIIEIPDDTITGFVNIVYGGMTGLTMGTLGLDTKTLLNGEAKFRGMAADPEEPEA